MKGKIVKYQFGQLSCLNMNMTNSFGVKESRDTEVRNRKREEKIAKLGGKCVSMRVRQAEKNQKAESFALNRSKHQYLSEFHKMLMIMYWPF